LNGNSSRKEVAEGAVMSEPFSAVNREKIREIVPPGESHLAGNVPRRQIIGN